MTAKRNLLKRPEIEISDNAKSTITRVYKSGGTLKFIAKNIIPNQQFESYWLKSRRIKEKKEIDYDALKKQFLRDFNKFYGIINLEKFTIEVISKSEIEKELMILKKRMFEYLSGETKKQKDIFFKRLIILKDLNRFKFVRLGKCYGLYQEDEAYLIAFCSPRKHILYKIDSEDENYD